MSEVFFFYTLTYIEARRIQYLSIQCLNFHQIVINSKWQNLLIWKKVAFQKYYIYLLYNLSNSLYMF